MVDTAQVIFTDHDGNTVNIFTKNTKITYMFPLEIVRQNALVGITVDPIRQYRVITCTAKMTGDTVNTLNGYLMDTTKAYDGTDPKISIALDGDTSLNILVAVTNVEVVAAPDRQWFVTFTFEERSL
jgi:hypothetical protein